MKWKSLYTIRYNTDTVIFISGDKINMTGCFTPESVNVAKIAFDEYSATLHSMMSEDPSVEELGEKLLEDVKYALESVEGAACPVPRRKYK